MRRRISWILAACLWSCSSAPRAPFLQESTEKVTIPRPTKTIRDEWVTRPTFSFPIPETLIRFELTHLPGGRFRMANPGSEPAREAYLKPFWIGKHAVTWGEFVFYYACPTNDVDGRSTPSLSHLRFFFYDYLIKLESPVVCLRWHSAMAYCRWLSRKTGHLYRLPTEVEWEYACRAGSDKPAPEPIEEHAWFGRNSEGFPHKGGGKKPNAFGLQDMLVNAWEYCLEPFNPPDSGPVLHGGAWDSPAGELRADRRQPILEKWFEQDPNRPRDGWWLTGGTSLGFRLVRVADASDAKERELYASKIVVTVLKHEEVKTQIGLSTETFVRVRGEVKNAGDRTLEELHILAYFIDGKGQPHMMDQSTRQQNPTFTYCFPVLAHSTHPGGHREPLKPGQSRDFVAGVPMTYDGADTPGARVAGLVFARE